MKSIRNAIFPGILAGMIAIMTISATIRKPDVLIAAAEDTSALSQTNSTNLECSLSMQYPESIRQWCPLIESAAIENSLDPALIAAVMLQESGGNPDAYSSSGAVGLMQVMPRDGVASSFMCPNGPCFAARPSMQELFDPQFNIQYGSRMLSGLIQKYGNEREALRAYGPMDMGYAYADIVLNIYNNY